MSKTDQRRLIGLVKGVSRSFYLTVRVLPSRVRAQIGLAYLLARATDTIADTALIPVPQRLAALDLLRLRILAKSNKPIDFTSIATAQTQSASAAERALIECVEDALQLLATFEVDDQQHIRQVLDTITSGQELDLQRFACADATHVIALRNDFELDDYTYRVAGCVGEFWTKMCRAHLFPDAPIQDAWLLNNGVRFGKGLQLVNILRDLPSDLREGRCYLPSDRLTACGAQPPDLLNPSNERRVRPLYEEYLSVAAAHLEAGWEYTNALPFRQVRLRLACAWPLLIGAATLQKLRASNFLDGSERIKISRRQVRALMLQSVIWYPRPRRWRRLFTAKS